MPALADSIRFCQTLARRTGRNFYWSFLTLPHDMRRDMCVLYAFMRLTDDLGDNESVSLTIRRNQLRDWRQSVATALEESAPGAESIQVDLATLGDSVRCLPALIDLIRRRAIPVENLLHVIDGVESDLSPRRFETFADLEAYCYQVAGAVGLCCIHIWGFHGTDSSRHAIDCGTAFQLTNILRDLQEDARRGRVYLPQADLQRFDVSEADLHAGRLTENLRQLLAFQTQRAHGYYDRGARLLPHLSRPGRRIHAAMLRIYGGLLQEIERRKYDVFTARVELSTACKLRMAVRSWFATGDPRPARASD